jgi:hypothetical protein
MPPTEVLLLSLIQGLSFYDALIHNRRWMLWASVCAGVLNFLVLMQWLMATGRL